VGVGLFLPFGQVEEKVDEGQRIRCWGAGAGWARQWRTVRSSLADGPLL
jgi:hypothetical protein